MKGKMLMNIQLFGESAEVESAETETLEEDYQIEDIDYEDFEDTEETESSDVDITSNDDAVEDTPQVIEENVDIESIREEAYRRGIAEGRLKAFYGKVNQYTGEVIKDRADLEVYEIMQRLEQEGKDPIADFYKYTVDTTRKRVESQAQYEQMARDRQNDMEEFINTNPNIDIDLLMEDPLFVRLCRNRLGNDSLSNIYADYQYIKEVNSQNVEQAVRKSLAKQQASPGSLSGEQYHVPEVNAETIYDKMMKGKLD